MKYKQYVSRGGEKLAFALDAFDVDPAGLVCADLGCNVGGFTDCLLQRGAAKVYAVDTGYGELAWTLRNDERVVVMERTNALHAEVPEPVDLVTVDVAWTPQQRILPAARGWLKPTGGTIISLLKPHFELAKIQKKRPWRALDERQVQIVLEAVRKQLDDLGLPPPRIEQTPLRGKGGNVEFVMMLKLGDAGGAGEG